MYKISSRATKLLKANKWCMLRYRFYDVSISLLVTANFNEKCWFMEINSMLSTPVLFRVILNKVFLVLLNLVMHLICHVLYLLSHSFHFFFQYWYNWIGWQTFLQLHDCLCILHYLIAQNFWIELLKSSLKTFKLIYFILLIQNKSWNIYNKEIPVAL